MSSQYPDAGNAKRRAVSARRESANASIRSEGLGAKPKDLEVFRKMAPLAQRREIREGMAAVIVSRIAREMLRIPLQTFMFDLGLPSSAILRKIAKRHRLSCVESDRVARVLYTFDWAVAAFEDEALAAGWMLRSNIELAGLRPLEVLDSQPGYDRVRDLLMRITFGVAV